jgi:hypothetical protein
MSALAIINATLLAASPVTTLVAARIYPGELPQGTVLPAIGISDMGGVELPTIDASAAYTLVEDNVQVTVLAKDYVTQKSLKDKVRAACNFKRGSIGGFQVVSVRRTSWGADMRDSDLTIFGQTIDFKVTWQEPNP